MKKIFVIITILLMIFIGMFLYQKMQKEKKTISIEEVKSIEDYLQKIYLWKEVTGQAIPNFNTIEEAQERWIWEVAKKNLEEYELTKEQIEEKAKEIFGLEFSKQLTKETTEIFHYNQEAQVYYPTEIILNQQEDSFLIDTIEKTKDLYEIVIIEYLEDYSQAEQGIVKIKNTHEEEISSVESNIVDNKVLDIVKENKNKFSKKKIFLKNKDEKLYVSKVEE